MTAPGICSGKTGILPEIDDRVLAMAEPISPSPVAPEAGPAPNTPAPDRADLRPENIQDAVIRLAGNSQDGIQTAGAFLARLAGRSDQDVMTYRSEEHTSELQSRRDFVCRLLLEKKKGD